MPSATDVRRARLETLREECRALETMKDALAVQMLQLQARIEQAENSIRDKKKEMSSLAPVYTLPEDVVVQILKMAYQHHFPHCRLDNGMPHINSPVAISHVSRRWRRLALSVPAIWTCVHVTPSQPSRYAEVIKAYLVRSRELPISIFFICETVRSRKSWWPWESFQRDHWPRYKSCWKYLLAERYRWKNCAIHVDHEQNLSLLLKSLERKTFLQLEYLRIMVPEDADPMDRLPDFKAPKLLHLRTDSIPDISKEYGKILVNLTQLTIFNTSPNMGLFLKMLRQAAPTLQTLSLVKITFYQDDDPTILPAQLTLTLPHLTHLTLAEISYNEDNQPNMCAFICRAATSLLHLSIGKWADTPDDLASGGLILPTVRSLKCEISPPTTREAVLAFPNLEMLQVPRRITETFTRAMSIDAEAHTGGCMVLPELKTLVLNKLKEEEFLAFAEHRARTQHPLRTLVLKDTAFSKLTASTTARLWELKLQVFSRSGAPFQVDEDWNALRSSWDETYDKPIMVPWENSTAFYDQFEFVDEVRE